MAGVKAAYDEGASVTSPTPRSPGSTTVRSADHRSRTRRRRGRSTPTRSAEAPARARCPLLRRPRVAVRGSPSPGRLDGADARDRRRGRRDRPHGSAGDGDDDHAPLWLLPVGTASGGQHPAAPRGRNGDDQQSGPPAPELLRRRCQIRPLERRQSTHARDEPDVFGPTFYLQAHYDALADFCDAIREGRTAAGRRGRRSPDARARRASEPTSWPQRPTKPPTRSTDSRRPR